MILSWPLIGGLAAGYVALLAAALAIFGGRNRVPVDRRVRPNTMLASGRRTTPRVIRAVESGLGRTNLLTRIGVALEGAGMTSTAAEFVTVAGVFTLALGLVGSVLAGWIVGAILVVLTPLGAKMYLGMKAGRRRAQFADQLDDTLQMLAGALRAGHSLLRAIDAVSTEADAPTSVEFARVINETRVGRDLSACLDKTAARMASDDFTWITQAIAIHREVGGDLAEVLDTVSHTIRERNQIRRQVKALSAEGRLSGIVLMAMPVGIAAFLAFSNPAYIGKLTQGALGWSMVGATAVLMTIGGFWLKKVVSFKF